MDSPKAPKRQLKTTITFESARRRRDQTSVSIRKQKKQQGLWKKRMKSTAKRRQLSRSTAPLAQPLTQPPTPPPATTLLPVHATKSRRRDPETAYTNSAMETEPTNKIVGIMVSQIPRLVRVLADEPSRAEVLTALKTFRKMLTIDGTPPISDVVAHGAVPLLVKLLGWFDSPAIQFETTWIITNIAAGRPQDTREVAKQGAIGALTRLAARTADDRREQAVWALGNIAGDCTELRDMLISGGVCPVLMGMLVKTSPISLLRNACWVLSNLARGTPPPDFRITKPMIPVLGRMLYLKDNEINSDACWCIAFICDHEATDKCSVRVEAVIQAGLVRRLVELLLHPIENVQLPALRAVANICAGSELQAQVVINAGGLPCLARLLSSSSKPVQKEACWSVSNVLAGNPDQIQSALTTHPRMVKPLISILQSAPYEVRKEAVWAVLNALTNGTPAQIGKFTSVKGVEAVCSVLEMNNNDEMVRNGLKILHLMLKANAGADPNPLATRIQSLGGVARITALAHAAPATSQTFILADSLISQYFSVSSTAIASAEAVHSYFASPNPTGAFPLGASIGGDSFAFGLETEGGGQAPADLSSDFGFLS